MRRAAGFTLMEVMLAVGLLAAAMALGFATLRAAGATAQRAQGVAGGQAVEQIRVLGDVHGDDLRRSAPCRHAFAPAPGESRS